MIGGEFAHGPALRVLEAGVPLERGIGFEKTIVKGPSVRIEEHFDNAETLIDGFEQRAVTLAVKFFQRRRIVLG